MFRCAGRLPTRQNSSPAAGPAGSSDKPLRAAVFRRSRALRNITVFSDGAENIPTAVPGRRGRTETDTKAERGPCDGCVYPWGSVGRKGVWVNGGGGCLL